MTEHHNSTEQLKDFIIMCLEEKKAENISVVNLENKTSIAKIMIFASGRSSKNVSAIADYVAHELKHKTDIKVRIEGLNVSEWVLIDIGDIIIHVFHPEARNYYKVEDKWREEDTNKS